MSYPGVPSRGPAPKKQKPLEAETTPRQNGQLSAQTVAITIGVVIVGLIIYFVNSPPPLSTSAETAPRANSQGPALIKISTFLGASPIKFQKEFGKPFSTTPISEANGGGAFRSYSTSGFEEIVVHFDNQGHAENIQAFFLSSYTHSEPDSAMLAVGVDTRGLLPTKRAVAGVHWVIGGNRYAAMRSKYPSQSEWDLVEARSGE